MYGIARSIGTDDPRCARAGPGLASGMEVTAPLGSYLTPSFVHASVGDAMLSLGPGLTCGGFL